MEKIGWMRNRVINGSINGYNMALTWYNYRYNYGKSPRKLGIWAHNMALTWYNYGITMVKAPLSWEYWAPNALWFWISSDQWNCTPKCHARAPMLQHVYGCGSVSSASENMDRLKNLIGGKAITTYWGYKEILDYITIVRVISHPMEVGTS